MAGFGVLKKVDTGLYLESLHRGWREREANLPIQIHIKKSQLDKGSGGSVEDVRGVLREDKRRNDPFIR